MPGKRFTCTLTKDEEAACTAVARVTVADRTGHRERACTRHAIATIDIVQTTGDIGAARKVAIIDAGIQRSPGQDEVPAHTLSARNPC